MDKFVDNLWKTLWINLWTSVAPSALWITGLLIHNLSTAYPQVCGELIHKPNSFYKVFSMGFPHIHSPYYYYYSFFKN